MGVSSFAGGWPTHGTIRKRIIKSKARYKPGLARFDITLEEICTLVEFLKGCRPVPAA